MLLYLKVILDTPQCTCRIPGLPLSISRTIVAKAAYRQLTHKHKMCILVYPSRPLDVTIWETKARLMTFVATFSVAIRTHTMQ